MKFSGVTRFTLLLAARAAVLMQTCGRKIEKTWMMPYGSTSFYETLEQALKRNPYYPLKILIDCDVDVKLDALPPLSAFNRRAVVDRQRAAHFPNGFLSASLSEKSKLGEMQALHMGCGDEPWLRDVLEHIQANCENRMEPLSFFAAGWPHYAAQIAPTGNSGGWRFVNILNESTGLRQIVLKDNKPVFTRLLTDCYPSLDREELAKRLAVHMRAGRDYLPRLGCAAGASVPAQLFVPAFLKDMEMEGVQLYALDAPVVGIVPPEWTADVAWLSVAAAQENSAMPIDPSWLRARRTSSITRKLAVIMLLCFGSAGVYTGVSILTKPMTHESAAPPPAFVVPAAAPQQSTQVIAPEKEPPEMNLEAVIYNAPDDWTVWINGEKHRPDDVAAEVNVIEAAPQKVLVRWTNGTTVRDIPLSLRKPMAAALVR